MSEQCSSCGKFTNSNIYYANWGSSADYEPPPLKFICDECWKQLSEEGKTKLMDPKNYWIPVKEQSK